MIPMLRKRVYMPSLLDELLNDNFFGGITNERFNSTVPAVNIKEGNDDFSIEVAAPGFDKKDFSIDLNNNILEVSSQKEVNSDVENEKVVRKEFSYRSFKRVFTLPETIDSDKIKANYKDGILTINIPKREEAKVKPVRQISIA
jgi:HSP20 family protein